MDAKTVVLSLFLILVSGQTISLLFLHEFGGGRCHMCGRSINSCGVFCTFDEVGPLCGWCWQHTRALV